MEDRLELVIDGETAYIMDGDVVVQQFPASELLVL